jgi:hypothetical protein
MIAGEVLPTGALPRTRVIPKAQISPQRPRPKAQEVVRQRHIEIRERDEWPVVADPAKDKLVPGHVAYVRTRWGAIKHYRIRLVLNSKSWLNSGRSFFIGTDRKGLCHRVWSDQVVSTQTIQQAMTAGRAMRAIGR